MAERPKTMVFGMGNHAEIEVIKVDAGQKIEHFDGTVASVPQHGAVAMGATLYATIGAITVLKMKVAGHA